jgi:hypothetical protein
VKNQTINTLDRIEATRILKTYNIEPTEEAIQEMFAKISKGREEQKQKSINDLKRKGFLIEHVRHMDYYTGDQGEKIISGSKKLDDDCFQKTIEKRSSDKSVKVIFIKSKLHKNICDKQEQ